MKVLFFVLLTSCLCLADMEIVHIKDAAEQGAVCLDGSPAIYYFKPGSAVNSTKWVIHLLGGGLCFNDVDCFYRSKTLLGSSYPWGKLMAYGGPISENKTFNPDYYDWNHAFYVYCDGACFSGNRDKPVNYNGTLLYYRGHRNLVAITKDLLQNKGLDKATEVLVTGDSAGAMATFFHVDEIKSYMPKSVTRFKGLPLSGIFLDFLNVEGKPVFPDNIKHVFKSQNSTVNQRCLESMPPQDRWKCMFAQYTMKYIESPIMPVGSAYDFIGTRCVLGGEPLIGPSKDGCGNCSAVPGWDVCEKDSSKCTKEQWRFIEAYGKTFMSLIENHPKLQQNGNGLFEYNCHSHSIECTDAWMLYSTKGVIMRDAVRKWFFSDNEPTWKHSYRDCVNHESYSCNPVCKIPVVKPLQFPYSSQKQ